MTNYDRLVEAKETDQVVEIGVTPDKTIGVAGLTREGDVVIFQGAGDGSDDIVITPEEFNNSYYIWRIFD